MRLLHLHCIFLRQLYTYPVLFGLMLLHIFLILLVITGCTGWYSFLPALSIVSSTNVFANKSSFHVFRKAKIQDVAIPGLIIGKIILKNILKILHPSIHAASSISLDRALKKPPNIITVIGIANVIFLLFHICFPGA